MAAHSDLETPSPETAAPDVNEPERSTRNNWNNQVRRHALMQPDALALRFEGASITWSQLSDRVDRFAVS